MNILQNPTDNGSSACHNQSILRKVIVNIYKADESDFIKATHRIYHDAKRPSKISVSVLKE